MSTQPCIALIAAVGERGEIGVKNRLPWRLPADMAWFRRHTLGKPVIMGRRTFQSLGRPLPERHNIVLSRDPDFQPPGVSVAADWQTALRLAGEVPEVMVIGGERLYRQTLPLAQRLYLTRVAVTVPEADAFFPEFDPAEWETRLDEPHPADSANPHPYRFTILERRPNAPGRPDAPPSP